MPIFGGSKHKNLAEQDMLNAQTLQNEQANIDLRRNILANIRQERIAEAQVRFAAASQGFDEVQTSSLAGALGNIQSSFAEPIEYMYRTTARTDRINQLYTSAQEHMNKYAKGQKAAATAGKIVGTIGAVAGSFLGPVGTVVGGTIGTAVGSALGGSSGTKAAAVSATSAAISTGFVPAGEMTGSLALQSSMKGLSTPVTGQTKRWANAQNQLNWSRSQYYGTPFHQVSSKDSDWASVAGSVAGGLKAYYDKPSKAGENNENFLNKLFSEVSIVEEGGAIDRTGGYYEAGGTISRNYYSRGLM
jgi:hypothetical protein